MQITHKVFQELVSNFDFVSRFGVGGETIFRAFFNPAVVYFGVFEESSFQELNLVKFV